MGLLDLRRIWNKRNRSICNQKVELDAGINVNGMVQYVFHIYDNLAEINMESKTKVPNDRLRDLPCGPVIEETENIFEECSNGDLPGLDANSNKRVIFDHEREILEDSAMSLLFPRSSLTTLSTSLLLFMSLQNGRMSNITINKVFSLFSRNILPNHSNYYSLL